MARISQRLRISSITAAVLALTFVLAFGTMAMAQSEQSPKGLTGTWRVTVQLQNCATGALLGPSFSSMLSFNRGGTMTGTTTNPAFAPGERSSDFGTWKYKGQHTYTAVSEAFINFSAGMFQAGRQRISQAISVDGDNFLANAQVQFFDVNGAPLQSACAVAHGARFE